MRAKERAKKKRTTREKVIGIGIKALQITIFMTIFVLCVREGSMNMERVSAYKDNSGEDILTLEDYLAGGSNCFTEQLDQYRTNIDAWNKAIQEYSEVLNSSNWEENSKWYGTEYIYVGPSYKLQTESSQVELTNGKSYTQTEKMAYEYILVNIETKRDTLQAEYEELKMIYGGFSIVGYNVGDTFTVDIKKNDIFSDSEWQGLDSLLYGNGSRADALDDDTDKPKKTEKYIAEPLGNGAWKLYKWMYQWDIDLTIDGLVYGRMASSYKGTVDFTHFGLENNNPYGIVGATAYYVLRRIFLSSLPVIVIVMLIMQLFKNTNKGRAQLKEMVTNLLLVIAFLFVAPYALNLVIYFRDGILRVTNIGMTAIFNSVGLENGSVGGSVIGMMYAVYDSNHSLLNAFLLCAAVGSGFAHFVTYIKMAVLLTVCFAVFPLVLLVYIWNKKILMDWWNIFFPNLCAPIIDVILLQIPSIILLIYKVVLKGNGSIVLGILLMVIMWVTMAIRERIIKLLGFDGIGGQRGLGMMGGMMMLARQLGNSAFRRGGRDTSTDNMEMETVKEEGAFEKARGAIMERAQSEPDELPLGEDVSYNPELGSQTDAFLNYMDEYEGQSGEGTLLDSKEMPEMIGDFANEAMENEMPERYMESTVDGYEGADAMPELFGEEVSKDGVGVESDVIADGTFVEPYEQPVEAGLEETIVGNATSFKQPSEIPDNRMEMKNDIKPVVDEEFRESLTDHMARERYDNLAKMDGYNNEIAQNEATMRNSGYTGRENYLEERSRYMEQMGKLNYYIDSTRDRMNSISDKGSLEYGKERRNLTSALGRKSELSERVEQLDHAARLERTNAAYKQKVNDCMRREEEYAKKAELGGMRGNTYSNAKDYMYQRQVDNARRSLATFKNFDTKRYEGILTPGEKEAFYRAREMNQKRQKIFDAAGKAAGVAISTAGVAGAAAASAYAAYGGAGTSAMIVGASAMGTRAASGVAERMVRGTGGVVVNHLSTDIAERSRQRGNPVKRNDGVVERHRSVQTDSNHASREIRPDSYVLENLKRGAQKQIDILNKSAEDKRSKEDKVLKEFQDRANKGAE